MSTMQITYYQSLVAQGVPPDLAAQTVAKLDSHIDERINRRFDSLEAKLDAKFNAIDAKFDALTSKIDSMRCLPATIIGTFGVTGALVIGAAGLVFKFFA